MALARIPNLRVSATNGPFKGIDGCAWGVHAACTTAARSFRERTALLIRRLGGEEGEENEEERE